MRSESLRKYMRGLVDRFFKILPLWEDHEESLPTYLESLQLELIGFNGLMKALNDDSDFVALLAILQYLIDHPDTNIRTVKREVFRAISICNKLKAKHCNMSVVKEASSECVVEEVSA